MTSVDSGVDTGNDSNDGYSTFDSQSTTCEMGPVKLPTCVVYPAPGRTFEEAIGSLDFSKHLYEENLQHFQPSHYASTPLELDPVPWPAFRNRSGCAILESMNQRKLHRKARILQVHLNRPDSFFTFSANIAEHKLRRAVTNNDVERATALLADGVNPNCRDRVRRSVLHLAACRGYSDIVRLLLEKGADPNIRDSLGNTPLHLAACTNNVTLVTLLLKAGTRVDSTDHFGRSPLQLAQSKLRFLQTRLADSQDSQPLKDEAKQVVEMMLTYLDRCGQNPEAELLRTFSSQLTSSHTQEEVETGVQGLLASLENLSLEKSASDQKDCTNK